MTPAQAISLSHPRPGERKTYLSGLSQKHFNLNMGKMQLGLTHIWSPFGAPSLYEWHHLTPVTQPEP